MEFVTLKLTEFSSQKKKNCAILAFGEAGVGLGPGNQRGGVSVPLSPTTHLKAKDLLTHS